MSNHFKLLLTVCIMTLATACDEGKYTDLSCDDTFVPECLDATHLFKCENNKLTVVNCSTLGYCDDSGEGGAVCAPTYPNYDPNDKPTPKPAGDNCAAGDVRCSGDVVQTCVDAGWVNAVSACEYGCEDGRCKADPDTGTCESGDVRCSDNLVQTCVNGDWSSADAPCKYGCEEGKCKASNVQASECSADSDCQSGFSCNAGSCVPAEMLNVKAGEPCPEDWYEGNYEVCLEDGTIRYCDVNDDIELEMFETACANGCTKINTEGVYEKAYYAAVCKTDVCQSEGQELSYCASNAAWGAQVGKSVCLTSSDGSLASLSVSDFEDMQSCMNECNEAGTDCDQYGYTKDSCDFVDKCDENNVYWYCMDLGIGIAQGVLECSETGSVCDSVNGEYSCWETCTEPGDIKKECDNDPDWNEHILWTGTCTDLGDGRLYYLYEKENCGNLCDEEALSCTVVEPGSACDEDDFYPECIGNSLAVCDKGVVTIDADCSEYGEDYVCGVIDGIGGCMEKCTQSAETKQICVEDEEEAYRVDLECMADNSGELVWAAVDDEECPSHACRDDACLKLLDNEGAACPDNMQESCVNNIVSFCDDGIVTPVNCNDYEARCGVVEINGNPVADCYTDNDTCDEVGTGKQICEYVWFSAYEAEFVCLDTDIGRYYVMTDAAYCDGGCNEAETACE